MGAGPVGLGESQDGELGVREIGPLVSLPEFGLRPDGPQTPRLGFRDGRRSAGGAAVTPGARRVLHLDQPVSARLDLGSVFLRVGGREGQRLQGDHVGALVRDFPQAFEGRRHALVVGRDPGRQERIGREGRDATFLGVVGPGSIGPLGASEGFDGPQNGRLDLLAGGLLAADRAGKCANRGHRNGR